MGKRAGIGENLIFALDIGTRSVIGIVGFMRDGVFRVLYTEREEYKTRAVVDGQIEDISETAKIAVLVKERLEKRLGKKLDSVYIAAAGRVLRTIDSEGEITVPEGKEIDQSFVSSLERVAVQSAYEQLALEQDNDENYFSVGYAVKKYTLDGYEFSGLIGHKGTNAGVSLIVTFLPKEVVDSLYATMNRINLTVSGLTLEPIAAMNAIIPPDLRKLNLALCDIGAGTSDIAVCEGGSVCAYTVATVAGDEITEAVMQACLVDFQTAERIKKEIYEPFDNEIEYQNIMGMPRKERAKDIFDRIEPTIEQLAEIVCERIIQVNGKTPSAVFLVGGGSQTPGLRPLVAKILKLDENMIAVGGNVYIKKMFESEENILCPDFATPLGIA
ncbi:MAG: cell division protein FtsA, partial [Ruminococcaceae bacterium]|nr:cell division protein FtsA [Oscillospiraceae bacterium]